MPGTLELLPKPKPEERTLDPVGRQSISGDGTTLRWEKTVVKIGGILCRKDRELHQEPILDFTGKRKKYTQIT